MAYQSNTAGDHPGYHGSDDMPFFEEEESQYSNSKYDSKDDPFGAGYNANSDEDKKEEEMSDFEQHVEEEAKQGKEEEEEDFFAKKAAETIRFDDKNEDDVVKKKKNSSIEEAINKAITDEKEVVHLDN